MAVKHKPCFKTCLTIVLLLLAFRCATLNCHAFSDPTEGRYALISKDIITSGDWLTPHLWRDSHRLPKSDPFLLDSPSKIAVYGLRKPMHPCLTRAQ